MPKTDLNIFFLASHEDKKFPLDWFRPHHGPTYDVGQEVEFLSSPKNRNYIKNVLRKSGAGTLLF